MRCWTSVLIQDLIYQKFHVLYNRFYVCELLRNLGFSFHKARFISDHLDEEARQRWMKKEFPKILKQAQRLGAPVCFGDEASFALWGSLSYTWGRKGRQTQVKTTGLRKGYKVFGYLLKKEGKRPEGLNGSTSFSRKPSGRCVLIPKMLRRYVFGAIEFFSGCLIYQGTEERFQSNRYQSFLLRLLSQVSGKVILIQDGARYHTSKATREFFEQHKERLLVYQLPSCSPDYNPIEYLWKKVKTKATHNRYFAEFGAGYAPGWLFSPSFGY
jgi:transposase